MIARLACLVSVAALVLLAEAIELDSLPWVSDGRALREGADWYAPDPAPEFRAEFVLPENAVGKSLGLWVVTPAYCEIELNGRRVESGQRPMIVPLWSPVDKTVYAELLMVDRRDFSSPPATNVVTVRLGNGWYNPPPLSCWGKVVFRDALTHGRPTFKLAIDGVDRLDWSWRETQVVQNSIQLGTVVDRTRPEDMIWKSAVTVEGPRGRIVPRQAPPVLRMGRLRGTVTWLKKGETAIVDFGENATGVPIFDFPQTLPGQRIEIVYGERLNADGSVNVLTQTAGQIKRGNGGPGAPFVAAQRDELICCGMTVERFMPPFTWHVCRYAEIRGVSVLPGVVTLEKLSSAVESVEPGRSYLPSDTRFLDIHDMCRRTFLANLVGVQSDCPGRERLGYGGDIVATCEAYMLNWDMREFYLKTLQDFADEAADDGWITETAPYVGIRDRGFGKRGGPISWALAVPVLMEALLRHYDERRALEFYPVCRRYIDLVDQAFPDGLVPTCIGDHEALDRAPDEVTATAHWHEFVRLTVGFAKMMGLTADQQRLEAVERKIAAAFAAQHVKEGIVGNGSQSAQAIGLYLGLVPSDQVEKAEQCLLKAIESRGYALSTGIFSTRYLLLYLSEHGRRDIAERLVLHSGFPGWLHMLSRGATTLWETWKESDDVYSNCHPMFGSVDEWLLRFAQPPQE